MRLNNIHVSSKEPVNPSLWVDTSGKKPILKGYVNGQYVILSEDVPNNVITKDMIVDSLESDATDVPLSAAQGKALKELINSIDVSEDIKEAINALDVSEVSAKVGEVVSSVSQTDGKISVETRAITEDDIPQLPQSKVTGLSEHISNTENPHSVTKEQVGLGNVDNTSDANKPVSTAQQAALDLKQDKLKAGTGIEITPENTINVTLDTTVFFVAESTPESPTDEQKKKICLVPASTTEEGNYYTEYVWVVNEQHPDGYWEEFGTYRSEVDLTLYLKKTDAESTYQKINDSALATNAKTVVGAINEVKSSVDVNSYKQYLRKVYEKYGAVYNKETGYWEYGDLKDMTEEDCFLAAFYALEQIQGENITSFILDRYKNLSARTYFTKITPKGSHYTTKLVLDSCFAQSNKLEYLKLSDTPTSSFLYIEHIKNAFRDCPKLRKIEDILTIYTSNNNNITHAFRGCSALKDVKIRLITGANVNISLEDSRLLSYESIKYLVDNAGNTKAITITVHPTTYSYLTGTAQPTEEVGGTTEEWQALVTTAQGKQISFA